MKLSVIIIVKNEEQNIRGCLESVKWADEIVAVDTGSADATPAIASEYTGKIFKSKWTGFGPLKNFALGKASGDWVLNIDADERVSPGLKEEIKNVLEEGPDETGFYIPFVNYFLGHRMRFGGLGGEKHIRLFRKDSGRFENAAVHEAVSVNGHTGTMKSFIEHKSYAGLEEYFEKFNRYTTLAARDKFNKGKKFPVLSIFRIPWEFFVRFFLKFGFLDGIYGFIYASLSAFYAGVKYFKLFEMRKAAKE